MQQTMPTIQRAVGGTMMKDTFTYKAPFGIFGQIAD